MFETETALDEVALFKTKVIENLFGDSDFIIEEVFPPQIHVLSHQKLYLRFVVLRPSGNEEKRAFVKYSPMQIEQLPLPRPIEQFLSRFLS